MKSDVLFRLAFCLVLLHGYCHVSSAQTMDGNEEVDAVEWHKGYVQGTGRAVYRTVGTVVEGDGENVQRVGGGLANAVVGDGEATELVDEDASELVDATGEAFGAVGECSGRRFKKCR